MNKDCDKKMHLAQVEGAKNKFGSKTKQMPLEHTTEHQNIVSRTTGRKHEIKFGPQPGGLVPANPFASLAQEGYMHAHPEILGKKALAHWDKETKGKKLPEKVKK